MIKAGLLKEAAVHTLLNVCGYKAIILYPKNNGSVETYTQETENGKRGV